MRSILAEEAKVGPPKRKFIEFEKSTLYTNGVAKHTLMNIMNIVAIYN